MGGDVLFLLLIFSYVFLENCDITLNSYCLQKSVFAKN